MKKILVGAIGAMALGLSAPASAADLAARPYTKAPPVVVAPIYDWTGFYIGGNGGWAQNHNCVDFLDAAGVAFASGCRDRSGGVIGGQLGYRWQSSQWVFGLEAQGDWADLSNQRVSLLDTTGALHSHQNQCHRPLYRPDRLRLECVTVLREGRRGGDGQPL